MNKNFEPGCYFDSHRGHYIIPEIIKLAELEGRKLDSEMTDLLNRYDAESHDPDYPNEKVIEESEAARGWLNDNCRPDGFWWDWNDGDFGLYPLENNDDEV